MKRLQDKVAVVTGASSGIGKAIAIGFAHEGADVIVNYRKSKAKAEAVVKKIRDMDRYALAVRGDMADRVAIESLIKKARHACERIDIWVNNAGADILTGIGADANRNEKLERLIEVDLKGTINACWAIVPVMRSQGQGTIINMSWDLAMHGLAGRNPQIFAAVKGGVTGFTRALAKTVGPAIRANVVSPGWIETAFAEKEMNKEYYQTRIDEIPLGRFGKPEEVAAASIFLASDESSYITGEAIKINGGLV